MRQAYVLMTALPPTYGHLDLIKFAGNLDVDRVVVFLNTQPEEPMVVPRAKALNSALKALNAIEGETKYAIRWQNETTQQEPIDGDDDAFWENWVGNLTRYGFQKGDYIVASEQYGVTLAEHAGGVFMPYDPHRWVRYTKGTVSRTYPFTDGWDDIIPEFRKFLQKKVTIFGAESTGKTTLTESLANDFMWTRHTNVTTLFEWARPYLEMVGPEVTLGRMLSIWEGQYALQKSTYDNALNPLVIQDTDLYTTLGFWENWRPTTVPGGLQPDAELFKSDLYLITKSNIPFEPDPLRYGGNERETPDQYWIDFCEKYDLPYVVLEESSLEDRIQEAMFHIDPLFKNPIEFKRQGAEYE